MSLLQANRLKDHCLKNFIERLKMKYNIFRWTKNLFNRKKFALFISKR